MLGQKLADVEDLFTVGEYVSLYNTAFGKSLNEADLPAGTDPIVTRIARHEGVPSCATFARSADPASLYKSSIPLGDSNPCPSVS